MKSKKTRDLLIILGIYILAYVVGLGSCFFIESMLLRMFVFDVVATVVTFLFSVICKNSSVYDAYWSLTPMVMAIWMLISYRAFSVWHILFLIAFSIWSCRLTGNWVKVFTDFSYEDWRYRKFREENHGILWFIINFFGIHMVPTLVVFAGMLPIFAIYEHALGILSVPGMCVILLGASFQFFADNQMHRFLMETKEKKTCDLGLWGYSRHPNYLGEIVMWLGVYLVMFPYAPRQWYLGIGVVGVAILFNVVSIPLMEKRQLSRRADYAEYRKKVSRLLLLPRKKCK